MATPGKSIVLTDLSSELSVERFHLDSSSGIRLAGSDSWSIDKRTLRGGVSDGVDVVSINNGALSFDVLPTRGFGLWRGQYQGLPLGWQSPVQFPVHPKFVNQAAHNGCGWLTGFNEWICRCGLSSLGRPGFDSHDNSHLTLHGEIANIPAHFVAVQVRDNEQGVLSLRGIVDEARLFGPRLRLETTIETVAGSNELTITDCITNLGSQPAEMQLLFHSNFGLPLWGSNSQVVASTSEIFPFDQEAASAIDNWSMLQSPTSGYAEKSYFLKLVGDQANNTSVLLRNVQGDQGVSLSFNLSELPCFTVWKNCVGETDGYVTGLEPGTSYPNHRSVERERGRVIHLSPGANYQASLQVAIHDSRDSVAVVEESIRALQPSTLLLHREPKW